MTARFLSIIREAAASARSQPVASIVSVIMVAGMCATVLLTTGRTVGAERAVLGTIDDAGTRSIIARADPDSGLDSTILDRIAAIDGIASVAAFGPAVDARNIRMEDGTLVPIRAAWGDDLESLGVGPAPTLISDKIWASKKALESLGMLDPSGGVETTDGISYSIVGDLTVPDYLQSLEPLAIRPEPTDKPGQVAVVVILADTPDLVAPIANALASVLAVDDPTKVKLSTSENLASLRGLVQGQFGSFSRELVVMIFALTAILVAAILYGLVMMRRKDFGRRRALGATRSFIIGLLLTQVALLALIGATVGTVAATVALILTDTPLPGPEFISALWLLAIAVGLVAALPPAVVAAHREPIRELRVP